MPGRAPAILRRCAGTSPGDGTGMHARSDCDTTTHTSPHLPTVIRPGPRSGDNAHVTDVRCHPRRAARDALSPWFVSLLLGVCATAPVHAVCPPAGTTPEAIRAITPEVFAERPVVERETLALGLLDCLASPGPALRDGLAFETLQAWLRAGALPPTSLRILRDRLLARLDAPDPEGVARPFAALMLSEIARTHRVAPWMRTDERAAMIERASSYLESVRDYRGFESGVGWRHGVAHGADWLMQLALASTVASTTDSTRAPTLDRAQAERMRRAIAAQAVPAVGHAYVFGESERLARPLLFIARRGLFDADDWTAWLAALVSRVGDPALAWKDRDWLARRHDLAAFLYVLQVEASASEDPGIVAMRPGLRAALKALP